MNHTTLIALASGQPDLAIDLANYRTAQQLALDMNLPPTVRAHWAVLADAAMRKVILNLPARFDRVHPAWKFTPYPGHPDDYRCTH